MKAFYKTPEELQSKIDAWIKETTAKEEPLTLCGLTYYLGFESRQSLVDYEVKDPKFAFPIKRAKLLIEQQLERDVSSKQACTGAIFLLKNYGWKDRQEYDVNHGVTVTRIDLPNKVPEGSPVDLTESKT